MAGACASGRVAPSADEKAGRILAALRPTITRAIEANDIRGGAKMDDIEANSAAAGDLLARAVMEVSFLDFGRATDEEVEEARRRALSKAEPELVSKLGGREPQPVRQMRERTLSTKRGPVRLRREYLYFPDLRVGLFPPRHTG